MLVSTMVAGWIGISLFLIIVFTFQLMMKKDEYAFLHGLMALMYALWFPLPLALYRVLHSDMLLAGTLFGFAYLLLLVITMVLQTGHIAFITKYNDERKITDTHGSYMMATLANPFESVAGIFKSIWAAFLGIAFWQNGEVLMACLMLMFGLLIFYYLVIMLDAILVKRVRVFMKIKPNPYFTNFETLTFFLLLMGYITFK